jgi:hypothetical protein
VAVSPGGGGAAFAGPPEGALSTGADTAGRGTIFTDRAGSSLQAKVPRQEAMRQTMKHLKFVSRRVSA